MHNSKHIVSIFLLGAILLTAPCCARMSVREAQRTVAVADSLRVNAGVAYDDSVALAEAYTTLGRWRMIYPDDYTGACYYYGRLLRNRGDQTAAMQAFICGTHAPYVQRVMPLPWFSDYHILGRIYSNMGKMCHLIDEFPLGYAMYNHAAKSFQKSGDTTAYYYALNDMALEQAEQKLYAETLGLIKRIELDCHDPEVFTKTWETKAILYNNLAQYDSVIYAAKQLYSSGYYAATGYVVIAQAFWCLQQLDSALFYAKLAVNNPYASEQDKYHMLYILCNCDTTIDTKTVQELAARRADINYEYIEPFLQQLSVAAKLLQQDYDSKRPYLNILLLLFVLCFIGGITWFSKKRITSHTLREMGKQQHLQLEQQKLISRNKHLKQQHGYIKEQYLSVLHKNELQQQELKNAIEFTCTCLQKSQHLNADLHLNDYSKMCNLCNDYFHLLVSKLHALSPLSERETRLCILVLIGLNRPQIAQYLNYSQSGIGKLKDTTAKKLGTTGAQLRTFLIDLAVKV